MTSEDKEKLKNFINSTEGEAHLDQLMDEYWADGTAMIDSHTKKRVSKNIIKEIHRKGHSLKIVRKNRLAIGLVASISAILVFWFTAFNNKTDYQTLNDQLINNSDLVQREKPSPLADTNGIITQETLKGQKSIIHLSDGSKVTLNAESNIQYAARFSANQRVIHLSGEAFFEVAKDANRPFIVIANGVSTTALGTSFNVNSRGKACKVSLYTGKVAVSTKKNSKDYLLTPGHTVKVDLETGVVNNSSFEGTEHFLWKEGVINFENATFKEVVRKLERWYNTDFKVDSSKITKVYTGRFKNEKLETVLESIAFTLDFNYEIHEHRVIITFD